MANSNLTAQCNRWWIDWQLMA